MVTGSCGCREYFEEEPPKKEVVKPWPIKIMVEPEQWAQMDTPYIQRPPSARLPNPGAATGFITMPIPQPMPMPQGPPMVMPVPNVLPFPQPVYQQPMAPPMGYGPLQMPPAGAPHPMGPPPMGPPPMGPAPMGPAPMGPAPIGPAPMGQLPIGQPLPFPNQNIQNWAAASM
jgi:hypothetical protein